MGLLSRKDNKKKQDTNELVCFNCGHRIVEDPETGKYYHSVRNKYDECIFRGKEGECGCKKPSLTGNDLEDARSDNVSQIVDSVEKKFGEKSLEDDTMIGDGDNKVESIPERFKEEPEEEVEEVAEPEQVKEEILEKPSGVEEKVSKDGHYVRKEVDEIVRYLLDEKKLSVQDAITISECVKVLLLNSVITELYYKKKE